MKTNFLPSLLALALAGQAGPLAARPTPPYPAQDSLTRGGYTLVFSSRDSTFSPVARQRMTDTFFATYPREPGAGVRG